VGTVPKGTVAAVVVTGLTINAVSSSSCPSPKTNAAAHPLILSELVRIPGNPLIANVSVSATVAESCDA
jgi:hypothetical protein